MSKDYHFNVRRDNWERKFPSVRIFGGNERPFTSQQTDTILKNTTTVYRYTHTHVHTIHTAAWW